MRCRPRLPCETLEHSTPALTMHQRTHTSMQGRQDIEKQLLRKTSQACARNPLPSVMCNVEHRCARLWLSLCMQSF